MNRTVDPILRRAFEMGGRRRCPQPPQPLKCKWLRAPGLPSYPQPGRAMGVERVEPNA